MLVHRTSAWEAGGGGGGQSNIVWAAQQDPIFPKEKTEGRRLEKGKEGGKMSEREKIRVRM